MRTRSTRLAVTVLAASMLTGCMTKPRSHVHYIGPGISPALAAAPSEPGRFCLATLGAGDPLGAAVYQNDVYLAYLAEVSAPVRMTGVLDTP